MFKVICLLSILFSIGCGAKPTVTANCIIEGNIKNLPASKIYLGSAHRARDVFDSAVCQNGIFKFDFAFKGDFEPALVSLLYFDTVENTRNVIILKNPTKERDGSAGFMLENDRIIIEGILTSIQYHSTNFISIRAGIQNTAFFLYQNSDLFNFNSTDKQALKVQINKAAEAIKKNPKSFFLLKELLANKETITKDELLFLMGCFDKRMIQSQTGKRLTAFIQNPKQEKLTNYLNYSFLNDKGIKRNIIDPNKKLNLIVFWASWCLPCRTEIPALKSLYAKADKKHINIVSISIDEKEEAWRKALTDESMVWEQLIIPQNELQKIKQTFSFSAIPIIIVADKNGNEIKRIIGFNEKELLGVKELLQN